MSKTQEIKEALEKAVPMKPIKYYLDPYCGRCGSSVYVITRYCPTCGQKIDWED